MPQGEVSTERLEVDLSRHPPPLELFQRRRSSWWSDVWKSPKCCFVVLLETLQSIYFFSFFLSTLWSNLFHVGTCGVQVVVPILAKDFLPWAHREDEIDGNSTGRSRSGWVTERSEHKLTDTNVRKHTSTAALRDREKDNAVICYHKVTHTHALFSVALLQLWIFLCKYCNLAFYGFFLRLRLKWCREFSPEIQLYKNTLTLQAARKQTF